jgi:dTDP-4-dehydrorhamnose 3,5-epimerase
MNYTRTHLAGAYLIESEQIADKRGFFARTWCQIEFGDKGLNPHLVQCSISYNKMRGTLRGMHYQKAPHCEVKLVRCTQGSIYDVIVDMRSHSKTYTQWFGVELTAENRRALYVPEGFAHGFITLKDNSEVLYQMSEFFHPDSSIGFRWNDPRVGIRWPIDVEVISERDCSYKDIENLRP